MTQAALALLLSSCTGTVTFITTSDPHFKGDTLSYALNKKAVEWMNCTHKPRPSFVWMPGGLTHGATGLGSFGWCQ